MKLRRPGEFSTFSTSWGPQTGEQDLSAGSGRARGRSGPGHRYRGIALTAALGVSLGLSLGLSSGCAGGVGQVKRWESEGNLEALKGALDDDSEEVRGAAAQAMVRYGAYDTGRPPILGTLNKCDKPEAKAAVKQLFGVPPQRTPDPFGSGAGGGVVLYLYRPEGDPGEARWVSVDGRKTARLQPGRYVRVETRAGSHRLTVEMPDEEAPVTDDPTESYGQMRKVAPMQSVIATPASGVYFVRHLAHRGARKPSFVVMPVPPGLAAVKELAVASPGDTVRGE